jgi:predicted nucleotide-binding protein (sugar kinase/HSP70/actin superfamily)
MNIAESTGRHALPMVDMESELRAFEENERRRLGLDTTYEPWVEDMANKTFTRAEKEHITLLVAGLTMAHDYFVQGALRGIGYHVQALECPDNAALRVGKEFGNRGQCNPTYFTVGNLVKFLRVLRDKHGMSAKDIISNYVFLTAGACGPCRFGMYVTEYRKALRDAGFDGFRVVLFQQTGGLSQATGEDSGLAMNPAFFWALVKALLAGDVLNALGYRIRPYEVEAGETDRAIGRCKEFIYGALEKRTNVVVALGRCKTELARVRVDRTQARPKVSIIGEFWAMTTEGDGNYQLQRFLESEGAEVDIQLVTAWLLFMLWEARHDTADRAFLRGADTAKKGLARMGPYGVSKKMISVAAADKIVRGIFQVFANAAGLHGYQLPDMAEIARVSHEYYNNNVRGGEGHMEVGKLIMNVLHAKAHMTVSVKPFGCMPSAGVSDGVQSALTERLPGAIFCPVETSGDGRVNFYSRVQMYLFKAKQAAASELERACQEHGVTIDQVRSVLASEPRLASALFKAPHRYAGTAADVVAHVAPWITHSAAERLQLRLGSLAEKSGALIRSSPERAVELAQGVASAVPTFARRAREDAVLIWERRRSRGQDAAMNSAAQ